MGTCRPVWWLGIVDWVRLEGLGGGGDRGTRTHKDKGVPCRRFFKFFLKILVY